MPDYNTIGVPPGIRLKRIERTPTGWRLWLSTRDYKLGQYLQLNNDGSAQRITARSNEGDEVIYVRPADKEIPMT